MTSVPDEPCIDRDDGVLFDAHDWRHQERPAEFPARKPTDITRFRWCGNCNLDEVLERAGEVKR